MVINRWGWIFIGFLTSIFGKILGKKAMVLHSVAKSPPAREAACSEERSPLAIRLAIG